MALLRQIREQSGLAYRAIERRAASAGDTLPPSTLATMLNRTTLPREELVVALLRAVGHDEQTIDQWVRARQALVSSAEPAQVEPPEPVQKSRAVPPRMLGFAICALVLVAAVIVAVQLITSPGGPDPGPIKIRNVHSGLCLDERENSESGDLFQLSCASQYVPRSLERGRGGIYRIVTNHPVYKVGCMGAAHATADPGNPVVDDYCDFLKTTADIELIAAPDGLAAYQIRIKGLCAEVAGNSMDPGAPVHLRQCDAASKGQLFALDRLT